MCVLMVSEADDDDGTSYVYLLQGFFSPSRECFGTQWSMKVQKMPTYLLEIDVKLGIST